MTRCIEISHAQLSVDCISIIRGMFIIYLLQWHCLSTHEVGCNYALLFHFQLLQIFLNEIIHRCNELYTPKLTPAFLCATPVPPLAHLYIPQIKFTPLSPLFSTIFIFFSCCYMTTYSTVQIYRMLYMRKFWFKLLRFYFYTILRGILFHLSLRKHFHGAH